MSILNKMKNVKFLTLSLLLLTQILVAQKHVTFDELQIINEDFYRKLDSLIKFEKKCVDSDFNDLHWKFSIAENNVYEFTATSGFSNDYKGFAIIDNSIVLLKVENKNLFQKTGKLKSFKIDNPKPHPEDYSVWLFTYKDEKMEIIKSFTLPCK